MDRILVLIIISSHLLIDREQNGMEEYSKSTFGTSPSGLKRTKSYCVNHATVVKVHDEHILPAIGEADEPEPVWDDNEGFDIQHVMSTLFKILGGYDDPDELFPGASMLVRAPVAQGPAPVAAQGGPAPVAQGPAPVLGVEALLRDFVESGWTEPNSTTPHDFDLWVVSVPVQNGEVSLVHMYAIKAFYKPEETTKTWDNIRRVTHLLDSFDEINAEEAFVFGVKGKYATRSFNHAESNFI
eukprot:scaffold110224_cov33-Attheya_sp.AAC.1